jgi:hypothetical protein
MSKGDVKAQKTAIKKGLQNGFKKCAGAIKNITKIKKKYERT